MLPQPQLLLPPPPRLQLYQVATSVEQPIDFAKVAADVVGVPLVIAAAAARLLLDCRPRGRFEVEVGEADVSSLQRLAASPLAVAASQVTRSYLLHW